MIDNLSLLANLWSSEPVSSGVTNADLIASQNTQNFVYFGVLGLLATIVGGIFLYMLGAIKDGFKETKTDFDKVGERFDKVGEKFDRVDSKFDKAKEERNDLRLEMVKIQQLLIYTKSVEQGVPPEQVEAEVDAAARRQLGLDESEAQLRNSR